MRDRSENLSGRLKVLPMPSPDMDLYNDILERGFQRFPDRRRNYERALNAERKSIVDYLPIKLDVENVSRCNFRCNMWNFIMKSVGASIKSKAFKIKRSTITTYII